MQTNLEVFAFLCVCVAHVSLQFAGTEETLLATRQLASAQTREKLRSWVENEKRFQKCEGRHLHEVLDPAVLKLVAAQVGLA